jgi:hypothetical protein
MNDVCWWTGYELYPGVLFFPPSCNAAWRGDMRYTRILDIYHVLQRTGGSVHRAWPLVRLSPTVGKRTPFNDEYMPDQMNEHEDLLGAAC